MRRGGFTLVTLFLIVGVLLILPIAVALVGAALEWTVEFWASYAKGIPVDVPYWPCLLGVLIGPLVIPAWVITLILSYAL